MEEGDNETRNYPPGYRFVPTDVELIREYLVKKVERQPLPCEDIKDIILYENNPMDLSERYRRVGLNEWYFFSPRKRKYPNGKRPDRGGNNGYWKPTGNDKDINFEGQVIGYKKVLVYYQFNSPKDIKTNWIMHEYRLNVNDEERDVGDILLDEWVVCKIHENKAARRTRNDVGSDPTSNLEVGSTSTDLVEAIGSDPTYYLEVGSTSTDPAEVIGFDLTSNLEVGSTSTDPVEAIGPDPTYYLEVGSTSTGPAKVIGFDPTSNFEVGPTSRSPTEVIGFDLTSNFEVGSMSWSPIEVIGSNLTSNFEVGSTSRNPTEVIGFDPTFNFGVGTSTCPTEAIDSNSTFNLEVGMNTNNVYPVQPQSLLEDQVRVNQDTRSRVEEPQHINYHQQFSYFYYNHVDPFGQLHDHIQRMRHIEQTLTPPSTSTTMNFDPSTTATATTSSATTMLSDIESSLFNPYATNFDPILDQIMSMSKKSRVN